MTFKVILTLLGGQTTPRATLTRESIPKLHDIIYPVLDGRSVMAQVTGIQGNAIEAQEM
jgi:hypothetical protein